MLAETLCERKKKIIYASEQEVFLPLASVDLVSCNKLVCSLQRTKDEFYAVTSNDIKFFVNFFDHKALLLHNYIYNKIQSLLVETLCENQAILHLAIDVGLPSTPWDTLKNISSFLFRIIIYIAEQVNLKRSN